MTVQDQEEEEEDNCSNGYIDEVQMVQSVPLFRTRIANKRSKYPWLLYSIEIQLLSRSNDGREVHHATSECM
jgi:hypothetical protein